MGFLTTLFQFLIFIKNNTTKTGKRKYMNQGEITEDMEQKSHRVGWIRYFYILGMVGSLLLILHGIGVI